MYVLFTTLVGATGVGNERTADRKFSSWAIPSYEMREGHAVLAD